MNTVHRDEYLLEREREVRLLIASQKQVPYEFRRDRFRQAKSWLAKHVGGPVGAAWSSNTSLVYRRLVILYRRTSTRVAGLVLNALDSLLDSAPGRT